MAKRTTILKVSGLRRAFGPNTIFDKFSLEVRTGEAIALTGRNGAGKSTCCGVWSVQTGRTTAASRSAATPCRRPRRRSGATLRR